MTPIHRLWLCTALFALANCSLTQKTEPELPIWGPLLTERQELQLGEQLYQRLAAHELKVTKDKLVVGYVEQQMLKLDPDARLHVIDDLSTVAAFSTPGGHVYVTTGVLLNVDNESELIGVLAHELGHIAGHHGTRQLVSEFGQRTLMDVAQGNDPRLLEQMAKSIATHGALLNNSIRDEAEADAWAVRYTALANYDPRGIALFFRKQPMRHRDPYTYLIKHPEFAERIEKVNQVIAREHLAGSRLGTEQLRPVQQHLSEGAPVSWR